MTPQELMRGPHCRPQDCLQGWPSTAGHDLDSGRVPTAPWWDEGNYTQPYEPRGSCQNLGLGRSREGAYVASPSGNLGTSQTFAGRRHLHRVTLMLGLGVPGAVALAEGTGPPGLLGLGLDLPPTHR